MTRPWPALALGGLARVLRRVALSLLAAVLVAFIAATVLVLTWLLFDGAGATGDAPHAWLGMFMVTLAFGSPSAVLFGLFAAPLTALAGRVHPGWGWLVCAAGGGALVLVTTHVRFAVFGVLGGLLYGALERYLARQQKKVRR